MPRLTNNPPPRLVEIDLSLGREHDHPAFNTTDYFLAKIGDQLHFGKFHKVWFGWHFSCGWGASGGMQFDAPGFNSSGWQKLWKVELE